jgi:hypothetical protein
MYDLGVTHLAVSGQQSTGAVLGDLWVTYEIELKKPILSSNTTSQLQSFYYTNTLSPSFSDLFTGGIQSGGSLSLTAVGRNLTIPKGVAGTYWVFIRVASETPFFTNPVAMAAPPVLTNLRLRDLDQVNARWETVTATSGTLRTGTFGFTVVKDSTSDESLIAFPLWTAAGGTVAEVNVIVLGTTEFSF